MDEKVIREAQVKAVNTMLQMLGYRLPLPVETAQRLYASTSIPFSDLKQSIHAYLLTLRNH